MGDASWGARWVMSAATLGTPPAGVKRVTSRLARAASVTARIGLLLTVLGAVSLVLSGAGSRWDWWDFRTGFAAQQRAGYPGLGPAHFPAPADRVFAQAVEVARGCGWEIVAAEPDEGRLEATDRTRWFGFRDDIVVRVRPDGAGSRVDVRSV